MKCIGMVYEHECFYCKKLFQFITRPDKILMQPVIQTADVALPTTPDFKQSHIKCPTCGLDFVIFGEFVAMVDDLEEFDEIEQHR